MIKKHEAKRNYEEPCSIMFACSGQRASVTDICQGRPGKKKLLPAAILVFLLMAIPTIGAEIDGQWVGTINRSNGTKLEMRYRFRAEGTRLIGLIETRNGGGPISEGKIEGTSIEFKIVTNGLNIINNGVLSGDEIHLTETIGTEKTKFVLKRVKYE